MKKVAGMIENWKGYIYESGSVMQANIDLGWGIYSLWLNVLKLFLPVAS